jgi:hypothetical protein
MLLYSIPYSFEKTEAGGLFFFFGFTLCRFIEILNSFVLNTLLPAGRSNFEKRQPQQNENNLLRLAGNVKRLCDGGVSKHKCSTHN